jgi:glycosyltransferase involved in cell wall biosynthesis
MSKKVTIIRSRITDPSFHKIAKTLSENDYNVKVLLWDRSGKKSTENINGYTIVRFGLKAPYDKIDVALFLPLWWLYEFFFLILESEDIIHACDFDTLLPGVIVKSIKKVKLYYMIYDFYADNIPINSNFIRKLVAFLEKLFIGRCDAVFIVDPFRYKQIKGASIKKLAIIYNTPPDYLEKIGILEKTKKKQGNNLVLFYAGIIHRSRGLIEILKALKELEDVELIIAGVGPDIKILEKLQQTFRNKIKYIGFIPYDEVIKHTLQADAIIALYDPKIPNNMYASPNKLFEAMMCAKPIIINKETAAANIVEKHKSGITVPYGDVYAIKNAIKLLKENYNLRLLLGQNGRKAYEKHFNWKLMAKKLIYIYNQLENKSDSD